MPHQPIRWPWDVSKREEVGRRRSSAAKVIQHVLRCTRVPFPCQLVERVRYIPNHRRYPRPSPAARRSFEELNMPAGVKARSPVVSAVVLPKAVTLRYRQGWALTGKVHPSLLPCCGVTSGDGANLATMPIPRDRYLKSEGPIGSMLIPTRRSRDAPNSDQIPSSQT